MGLCLEVPTLRPPPEGPLFRGTLALRRVPLEADPTLRAWDAADDLLIDWIEGEAQGGPDFPAPTGLPTSATLVVGDRFGAIALGLLTGPGGSAFTAEAPLRLYDDSVLTARAVLENARLVPGLVDRLSVEPVDRLAALSTGTVDRVLLKIPRSLGALEGVLHDLRPSLAEGAVVIGAGMTRRIHRSTLDAMATVIGPTVTSHARRKARLVHTSLDADAPVPAPAWPLRWSHDGLRLANYPGVFSAAGLDQGARAFLDAIPELLADRELRGRAVDLGCGNGVLGISLALRCPALEWEFRDVSFNALRSASDNFAHNVPGRSANFVAADALERYEEGSAELIVCNPPFHARGARSDRTAWAMFSGARRALTAEGELWVVGNRHLGYVPKLQRLFAQVDVVGSTPKFVVLRARTRG